jgi:hypothetical protein
VIVIVLTREERKMLLKLAGRGFDEIEDGDNNGRENWRGRTLARRVLGKVRDANGFRVRTMDSPMTTLELELVPSTSWGDNLRSRLSRSEWDVVRRTTYRKANFICEICGGVGPRHPVEAHEVWSYDDVNHVQTLVGMIALCPNCHQAKHIGRTLSVADEATQDRVLQHIMRVNRWPHGLLLLALEVAFTQHAERSQHQWTLDISWIEHLIGRKL